MIVKDIHGERRNVVLEFPGNLNFYATYILLNNRLKIKYHATTDKDTITNHSYFNLSGEPCHIDEHELMIKVDKMPCVDNEGLFNGKMRSVCIKEIQYV